MRYIKMIWIAIVVIARALIDAARLAMIETQFNRIFKKSIK